MRYFRRLYPFVLSLLFVCSPANAQDLPDVAQGLQPYVSYHGGQLDKVSTLNGGLTVSIPLVSYPQKGALALSYSVIYNSASFQDLAICIATPNPTEPVDVIPVHDGCTNNIQRTPDGAPGSEAEKPPFFRLSH